MKSSIVSGTLAIGREDERSTYQDQSIFTLTANPDESRTLRAVSRSPRGRLLRDVNQIAGPAWRPIEGMSRLFYKGECQGTVLRRVIGERLVSHA